LYFSGTPPLAQNCCLDGKSVATDRLQEVRCGRKNDERNSKHPTHDKKMLIRILWQDPCFPVQIIGKNDKI
jgi:hypothetical protein